MFSFANGFTNEFSSDFIPQTPDFGFCSSKEVIEGTVSINIEEVSHPIISNAFIQFHNVPTDMNPLEERFGILEITIPKTKDIYHETHHYKLPAIEKIEIVMKNAIIYDMAHDEWTTTITDDRLFSEEKRVFYIKTLKDSKNPTEAIVYGKVIGRKEEGELVDGVEELYTVYELPDLIDTTNNTIVPVDLTKYMYLQTALEMLCKLTEYKGYVLTDSDIVEIKKFMKKMIEYSMGFNYKESEEIFEMYDDMDDCLRAEEKSTKKRLVKSKK